MFTAMGLLLAVLHGIEAAFWAAAYLCLARSIRLELRSFTPSTTRGASGAMLQPDRQMMGALCCAYRDRPPVVGERHHAQH